MVTRPPNTPPKSCCDTCGLARPSALLKKLFESKASSRMNSNTLPRNWLEPERDTKLTAPPPAWPNSALKPLVSTANSVMASTDGELSVVQRRCSNGAPGVADTPSTVRSQPPSWPPPITMLPRAPSPLLPVLASGAIRLRSSGDRSWPPTTSGRSWMNLLLIAVVTLTLSVWIWRASADTVTASLSPPIASVPSTRSVAPAVSSMFSSVVVWKPFAVMTIT